MTNTICLDENYSTTRLLIKACSDVIANEAKQSNQDKFETVLFLPESEGRKGEGGLRTKGYFKKSYTSSSLRGEAKQSNKPLISIITVVFNGEKFLEETIQSVINQTYDNVEYIIIDGGSTDGTLDIIKKYEDRIDYWVSERDSGIYDAMNKGIMLCAGDIVGIVNADDYIYKNTLLNIQNALEKNSFDYTYGDVELLDQNGVIYGKTCSMNEKDVQKRKYKEIPFPHPTMFVHINVYKRIGTFDTRFKLSADYDFLLKILENDFKGFRLEEPTGVFRSGGQSGGFKTFYENSKLLEHRGVSKIKIYKSFMASLTKVFLANKLPRPIVKFLKKFHKDSKNELY